MDMTMTTTSAGMAMATNTMDSAMSSATATASGVSMSGMGMGGSGECKFSMLWNWYTIDACFLSTTWHITSKGMFAGSCISVIALVLLLEFLRRLQREYDRFLLEQRSRRMNDTQRARAASTSKHGSANSNSSSVNVGDSAPAAGDPLLGNNWKQSLSPGGGNSRHGVPTMSQQAVRAGIHTMQFSVAYIIMLLAMYYNGYIIVCIFIGVFIGFFVFSWDASGAASNISSENTACCA